MDIIYKEGHVLQSDVRFVFNPCDDQGKFNLPINVSVRESYPFAYSEYCKIIDDPMKSFMGQLQMVKCRDKVVFNSFVISPYTKTTYTVSYDALSAVFAHIESVIPGSELAIPKFNTFEEHLGDWKVISAIISSELKTVRPIVYVKNNFFKKYG